MLLSLAAALLLTLEAPAFVERPCVRVELREARCGTVTVPENRDGRGGRHIDLNVVVAPATGEADLPPLFDIDGGPGLPASKNAEFYLGPGAAYRARRDIVMIDQRGTGGSNPLNCPEMEPAEGEREERFPVAVVAACRDRLAEDSDLRRYGTREAVADLEAVRIALGYEQIDIFGLSYGTTVALRYMGTYPGRVRAAVLMGVAPPDAMAPRHHAVAAERALRLLFADCAADAACHSAFPDPDGDLDRALARLRAGSGAASAEMFMERLRSLLYRPFSARRVPWLVHRAAEGDFTPFDAATARDGSSMISGGMFFSVTCAESFGLMDYEAAAAASRATRFGDYRLRRQRAACEAWPPGEAAPDHLAPVRSDAAVLLLSGRLDPVTPPAWADAVAEGLPNSRHFVLPHGGHVLDGLSNVECFDRLVLEFLDTGDATALDPACLSDMLPPPFATGAP